MKAIVLISALLTFTVANEIRLRNNCAFTIWPGILGNPGRGQPENGGFELGQNQSKSISVGNYWAGRVWARTNCDSTGRCETGDCGGRIQCNGAGAVPPVSLAEITLKGYEGYDFYDISLINGYNLPIKVVPLSNYTKTTYNEYDCNPAGCHSDLNPQCPDELTVRNSGGLTIGCTTACLRFNNDRFCCRGIFGTSWTCKFSNGLVEYSAIYKRACPNAHSYAYDDAISTFTCKGKPNANYEIVFCP